MRSLRGIIGFAWGVALEFSQTLTILALSLLFIPFAVIYQLTRRVSRAVRRLHEHLLSRS